MKIVYKFYWLIILLVAVLLSGCGKYEATSDLVLGGIEIDMPKSDVDDLYYTWVKSEGAEGYGYETLDHKFTVGINKERKVWAVSIYRTKTYSELYDNVATKFGITLNSSVDEIEKRHGVPTSKFLTPNQTNEGTISYRIKRKDDGYGTLTFVIDLRDNRIKEIRLSSWDTFKNIAEKSVDNDRGRGNVNSSQNVANENNERKTNNNDKLSLGGISLKSNESEIKSILGTPLSVESKGDGITVQKFKDVEIHLVNNRIQMIVSNSPNAKTSRGIHEQSSLFDAVKEYGGAYETSDYGNYHLVEYKVDDSNIGKCIIRFASEKNNNDKVSYISIRRAND